MNWLPPETPPFGERIDFLWKRGVRLVTRAAIAFAMSTAAAIGLGAAVTDNGLAQTLITVLAALAFWVPSFFMVVRVDKWFARRETHHGTAASETSPRADDHVWRRLFALAPAEAPRLAVLRRSLERSRQSLGRAELDPEAHELCILIDRRLPELIHHELEILPPDDMHRRREVRHLINLVEQFARHCSRRGSAEDGRTEFQAKVLRRRFEARLSEF